MCTAISLFNAAANFLPPGQTGPALRPKHFDGALGDRVPNRKSAGDLSPWDVRTAMYSAIPALVPPVLAYLDKRRQHLDRSVHYNNSGQLLDIWRGANQQPNAPVLIWVPGGAWVSGTRMTFQGHALMSRMIKRGWMCLSIDYRVAPWHRWPLPLRDVRAALAWARNNIAEFGGDPNFVAIAGASAGGHLATLTGLLDRADAVVSIYGSYDWESRSTLWRKVFMEYLERVVVGKRWSLSPEVFCEASPMAQIHSGAPPMMIVHGTKDRLIPVAEARNFHRELCAVSRSPVRYLELPVGHAFDVIDARRSAEANRAIAEFLDQLRPTHSQAVA